MITSGFKVRLFLHYIHQLTPASRSNTANPSSLCRILSFSSSNNFMSTSLSNEYGAAKEMDLCKTDTLKNTENSFQDKLSLNAGQKYCKMLQGEHSAILSTFIKLPFVIKIFVLSIFEWPFYIGFTVSPKYRNPLRSSGPSNTYQFGEPILNFWVLLFYRGQQI